MKVRPLLVCLGLCACGFARADDWPQWRGPQRDGVWRERGIVEQFPGQGLPVLWRVPVAGGYAGPAVADGRVLVTDYQRTGGEPKNDPNARVTVQGRERVLCLSADDGRLLWTYSYDRPYNISYAAGPRATPTVDGDRVYTLGAEGDLVCLEVDSGVVVWHKHLPREYGVETPMWGFAGHPLVAGDLLYCLVGGQGSVAVAFDKRTGNEVWRALSAPEPGYCPPTMIEAGGTRQLLIWHVESLNSLNPQTGELYWSQPLRPLYGMSIAAPQRSGPFLFASGIGDVAALFRLADDRPDCEVVWRAQGRRDALFAGTCTPMIHEGMIYGVDCQTGTLCGVRLETGERLWQTFEPTTGGDRRASHGTAFIVRHEDRFFLFSETGDLILARLLPEGYDELDRFHVLEPTGEAMGRRVVWSHPAFAQQCVFARNDRELVCVSLRSDEP